MAGDRDGLIEHYRQMRRELLAALAGVPDAELCEATLDGWSVKDHLAHIALWDDIRADEIGRISAGFASAWDVTGDDDAVASELGYRLRRGWTLDQAKWELARSHQRVLDAVWASTAIGLEPGLYGDAGLRSTHEREHTEWVARWRRERGL